MARRGWEDTGDGVGVKGTTVMKKIHGILGGGSLLPPDPRTKGSAPPVVHCTPGTTQ